MSSIYESPLKATDSEQMSAWIELRRQLEDRITDEETRNLLHVFIQLDLEICEDEANQAFWKGVGAGISIVMEKDERERQAALKLYRRVARNADN
ncbi:MAG: hypothetical protein IJX72_07455 [Clostridia bacterium]|nr:hypothetical protein [Clostridia bacterium]